MMEEVKEYIGDQGHICIASNPPCGEENVIILHPDQVDILIKWLQELKSEIQNKQNE